jgi:hypothetical protein
VVGIINALKELVLVLRGVSLAELIALGLLVALVGVMAVALSPLR